MEMLELKKFYHGKKVFITGHTGFKGAWLALWLHELGAEVTGYALAPEDFRGNLFTLLDLQNSVHSIENSICNKDILLQAMNQAQPDLVFHLAAQPLVLRSYEEPVETFASNLMGTVHVLEGIRHAPSVKSAVIVTTDKCYQNKEWVWPYRENDRLGGHDPYASSKAMAELAVESYRHSFFTQTGAGIASARAGNVIGGGDFGQYRIIPDIVEAISRNTPVVLRNPHAIRPWQHVLDALYGYLLLGMKLYHERDRFSTSFNFGPNSHDASLSVEHLTNIFITEMKQGSITHDTSEQQNHESHILKLDSNKARTMLSWQPQYCAAEAIAKTAAWYNIFIQDKSMVRTTTYNQIRSYMETTS